MLTYNDGTGDAIGMPRIVRKGIAYFATFEAAREFGRQNGRGFPAWRVVPYELGYAVQVRPSGPYFSPDGVPA